MRKKYRTGLDVVHQELIGLLLIAIMAAISHESGCLTYKRRYEMQGILKE